MNAINWVLQLATLALALALGYSLARQGVINAQGSWKIGTFAARILGRTVAADLLEIRPGKYYYRVMLV